MKKSLFVLIPVILIGTQVFAQENSEDTPPPPPPHRGFTL
jgi:hypothetical protein